MAHAAKVELWLTWTGSVDQYNIVLFDDEHQEVGIDVVPLRPALDAHAALERATKRFREEHGFDVPLFL